MCLASVDTGKRLIVVPLGLASVGRLVGDELFFEDPERERDRPRAHSMAMANPPSNHEARRVSS